MQFDMTQEQWLEELLQLTLEQAWEIVLRLYFEGGCLRHAWYDAPWHPHTVGRRQGPFLGWEYFLHLRGVNKSSTLEECLPLVDQYHRCIDHWLRHEASWYLRAWMIVQINGGRRFRTLGWSWDSRLLAACRQVVGSWSHEVLLSALRHFNPSIMDRINQMRNNMPLLWQALCDQDDSWKRFDPMAARPAMLDRSCLSSPLRQLLDGGTLEEALKGFAPSRTSVYPLAAADDALVSRWA